jgi:hypothetical protein
MMMEIKRGEAVFYRARGGVVRATVKTLHKDGSVSVRAHFFVDEDGKDMLGHLGVTYRVDPEKLAATAAKATT